MDFKNRAKSWDNQSRSDRSKIIADKIIELVGKNRNSSVMEYGCATGLIGFNICNAYKTLTLMDSEEEMINIVKEKIEDYKIDNVSAIKVDLVKDDYSEEKFDIIYTSLTLHHILDIGLIIQKFYNLLNEHGILCIIDLDTDDGSFHMDSKKFNGHNGFTHQEIEKILKNNGFFNIKSETFFHGTKQIRETDIPYSIFYSIGYK